MASSQIAFLQATFTTINKLYVVSGCCKPATGRVPGPFWSERPQARRRSSCTRAKPPTDCHSWFFPIAVANIQGWGNTSDERWGNRSPN